MYICELATIEQDAIFLPTAFSQMLYLRLAVQRPNAMHISRAIRKESEQAYFLKNHFIVVDSSAPGTTLPVLRKLIDGIAPEIRIKMKTMFIASNYANVINFYETHVADWGARVSRVKRKDMPLLDQFEGYDGVYRLTFRK